MEYIGTYTVSKNNFDQIFSDGTYDLYLLPGEPDFEPAHLHVIRTNNKNEYYKVRLFESMPATPDNLQFIPVANSKYNITGELRKKIFKLLTSKDPESPTRTIWTKSVQLCEEKFHRYVPHDAGDTSDYQRRRMQTKKGLRSKS